MAYPVEMSEAAFSHAIEAAIEGALGILTVRSAIDYLRANYPDEIEIISAREANDEGTETVEIAFRAPMTGFNGSATVWIDFGTIYGEW